MGLVNMARATASPLVRGRPPSPPDVVLSDAAVRADPDRLAAYARACGYTSGPAIPPAFPHVLAFDLVTRLMTRRDFPFALPGLIHVRNTITVGRPIGSGEALTLRVHAGEAAEHPKGHTVDILTSVTVDEEPCWSQRSTYLRRAEGPRAGVPGVRASASDAERESARSSAHDATAATRRCDALPAVATWDLPEALGRRYARISGDWNPIHLRPWTARPFGFRRPIAHGMWTLARTLASMPLPGAFTVDVAFAAPLPLPSRVELATDGERLAVRPIDAPDARPHLTGAITPAQPPQQ